MKTVKSIGLFMGLLLACYFLVGCDNTLSIKQDYDFTVTVEKYRTDIAKGETIDFVFHLLREGDYAQTRYSVSCFIRDGKGEIYDKYGNKLKMNTPYPVYVPDTYQLSYTSLCSDSQTIELTFSDSFGKVKEVVIELQNKRDN